MAIFDIKGTAHVFKVSDFETSLAFYQKWLGEPDEIPDEGMAEWQLTAGAWLQLDSSESVGVGQSALVIEVEKLEMVRQSLQDLGLEVGEVVDYGFIRVSDLADPDGNRISLVEMVDG